MKGGRTAPALLGVVLERAAAMEPAYERRENQAHLAARDV